MYEGVAQQLPEPDGSVDLIVLVHVEDLVGVFGEFGRVLRPGGAAVIYRAARPTFCHNPLTGTPPEIAAVMHGYAALGVRHAGPR